MSRFPLIGLPTLAIPPGPKPPRFGINQSYVRALSAAGCAPVLIPVLDDEDRLRAIYDRLDGIVFPGGADVAPHEYGEEPIGNLNVVEPPRDRIELTLARWAFADDLPTLGICRGQQLLNVALGGSLYQDLRHQGVTTVEHSDADGRARNALLHRVRLDPSSRLAQLIDETSIEVNSLHHQAVKVVAAPLKATGTSEDGVIESLESDERRFLIAVQWHPEEIDDLPWVQRLFAGFARAASGGAR
ncbi:MAG TPA: gamma-glutamyl-gamma-aminobutyrate hydrolase family protein [Candidatus Dormibacteraeota bacterium]|nr:gamma-glutamyl-gamma-aminobutyrate hydrolase family protein [Candidatus Dormibacteraeota bacterium]